MDADPRLVGGRYRLGFPLGEEPGARWWQAHDLALGRDVVLTELLGDEAMRPPHGRPEYQVITDRGLVFVVPIAAGPTQTGAVPTPTGAVPAQSAAGPARTGNRRLWIVGSLAAAFGLVLSLTAGTIAFVHARADNDAANTAGSPTTATPAPTGPINAELIDVGTYECLAIERELVWENVSDIDASVVDCDSPEAGYRVLGVATGVARADVRRNEVCDGIHAKAVLWSTTDGLVGHLLCLDRV